MDKLNLNELEKDLKRIISTRAGRRAFLQASPILLAGCATTSTSDRHREGDNSGQQVGITPAEEKQMTAEYIPKMAKDYPPIQHSGFQNYITRVGQKIVQANGLVGNPYSYNFTVVDSAGINAFALPAGTVYVTAPLIAMADSEAELAGVIGHEVGHIQARHTAERMYLQQKSQKKSLLWTLGGVALGGLLGVGVGRLMCDSRDKECLTKATKTGAMLGVAGGLLVTKYGFMANSREDEMEADRIGFRTSVKAGYHKDHVGRFYNKLLDMEKKRKQGGGMLSGIADAMSTHPPSQERVNQMMMMAGEARNANGQISSKTFEQYRAYAKQVAAKAKARAEARSQQS